MNEWQRLESCKAYLSRQEFKTIKGQIRAGDVYGAMRGLDKLMEVRCHSGKNKKTEKQSETGSGRKE